MMTPHEIKLLLERRAIELKVRTTGLHSCCLIGDDHADAIFDITPDESGCGLHFTFPLPHGLVSASDLRSFSLWLASPNYAEMTMH